MKVGLVLGAGGRGGLAYASAVLAGLERDLGWDARTADVVVGTSTGSVAATLLRCGVSARALAAMALSVDGCEDLERCAAANANAAAAASGWPDDDLWLCAVRRTDCERVVFGHDASIALPIAVRAACAIPGQSPPVEVDGEPYVDAGVYSVTNADVLCRAPLDLAIVVSPLTCRGRPRRGVGGALRRSAKKHLRAEVRHLRGRGTAVVVLEPDPDLVVQISRAAGASGGNATIVAAGLNDTAAQLQDGDTRELLAPLGNRSATAAVHALA